MKNTSFSDSIKVSNDIVNMTNILPKIISKREKYIKDYLSDFLLLIKDEYNLLRQAFPDTNFCSEARVKSYESTINKFLKCLKNGDDGNLYDIFANRYIILDVNGSTNPDLLKKRIFDFKDFLSHLPNQEYISKKYKNYIDNPKDSTYQSLHMTRKQYCANQQYCFETQIRSKDMDINSKYGLASHKKVYKNRFSSPQNLPDRFEFILDDNGYCTQIIPIPFERSYEEFFCEKYEKKQIIKI